MKTLIQKTLAGALIFFAVSAAQAVYCNADCTVHYRDILSTLSGNATRSQMEDFRADCAHRNGTLGGGGYTCYRTGTINSSVYGSGSDLYQARQAAREQCSQKSQYYSNASTSTSNFQCSGS